MADIQTAIITLISTSTGSLITYLLTKKDQKELEDYKTANTRILETYKEQFQISQNAINSENSQKLEGLKKDIQIFIGKHNVLHQKRFEVVSDLYQKLLWLDTYMKKVTGFIPVTEAASPEKVLQDALNEASSALAEFNNKMAESIIYFDSPLADLLKKIGAEYFDAFYDFFGPERLMKFTGGKPSGEFYGQELQKSIDAANRIRNHIPELKKTVEEEFKKVIGVLE